jgi:hypothetical protein
MAYEARNGKRYFYRKRRAGGRVTSAYVGSGPAGELAQAEAARGQAERAAWRETVETVRTREAEIELAGELIRALTRGTLLATGYRRHKGQWRRMKHD